MSVIYHILGADIPQHNQTVLRFFQQDILPELPDPQHRFWVVGKGLSATFPDLTLREFESKKAIASALVALAATEPYAKFVLHGQFNIWIWLAIWACKLPACRLVWHVWGADLYQSSTDWKFKLFYPLRRHIQKRLPAIWATRGDLDYVWKTIRPPQPQDRLIYFPTRLDPISPSPQTQPPQGELKVLLGNSGDPANRHIEALTLLQQQLGRNIKLIIPMGYPSGNEAYIQRVETVGKRLFPAENLQILRQRLDFAEYQQILSACDLGYFHFERQQGIGTICLLIQHNIPLALHRNNPFCLDMQAENVPFLCCDTLSAEQINATRQALCGLDKTKIGFFPPNYQTGWIEGIKGCYL